MRLLRRLRVLARNLFTRNHIDTDLDAELRAYGDLLADEKERQGLDPERARRAALVELGGVEQVKEEVRDVRTGAVLDILARDIRFAARSLARTPSFTVAAVVALALGIGANTTILSVVDAVLLRPLAYRDADRLAVILHDGRGPVAPANFDDWRRQTRSFSDMAVAEAWSATLTGGDVPERVTALHLSGRMFPMLGVAPVVGRVFTNDEDVPGRDKVVVLSYGLWQRKFAGDRGIVGRTIALSGEQYTVIGVMPAAFHFAPFWVTNAELYAPIALGPRITSRGGQSLRVFARLAPGVTLQQARTDLASVTSRLEREYPGTNADVMLVPLKEKVVGDIRTPLVVLLVAVCFVLLTACANVAHMLLARASARHRELAVRTALGATRRRLVTQLLVESSLLAVLGGAAGLMLAMWGVRALVAAGPSMIPRVASVAIDSRVLLMTMSITAVTAIVFGLIPAFRAARVDLAATFRDGDRASTEGGRRHTLRSVLVASEFALALVLLVGAGLMIRSFNALRHVDAGFDPRDVVSMTINVQGTRLADPAVRASFYSEALGRAASVPGVGDASFINHLPIAGDRWGFSFAIEGRPRPRQGAEPSGAYRVVFPGYFKTMRIPLLRGRDIAESDRLDAPRVVVINEFMAKTYWPNEDAIGKRLFIGGDTVASTVVGIAKNTVREQWTEPSEEEFFVPFFQQRSYLASSGGHVSYLTLVARAACGQRSACSAASLAAPIASAIRGIDRSVVISDVQTMSSVVDHATAESRFYVTLLSIFASIALTLAAVGIYGVMSYSVSQRTSEIGIRIALGANPASVVRHIVGGGLRVALIGAGVGLVGAFALTRLMSGLLYGVGATDPVTFAGVTLTLCGVALAASYLPARRAASVDPLTALRAD